MRKQVWVIAWSMALVPLVALGAENITGLSVTPSELTFRSSDDGMRVLVTGTTAGGEKLDLTASARFEPAEPIVKTGADRLLYAVRQGETKVTVSAEGRQAELTVHVGDLSKPPQISFIRDVEPVLNKIGCTAGTCHGSAKGKNGFKLSLRGYDPDFDYEALLYDMSGRRFNRADPARSLMLAKPTQQVAHGGGLRIELGSRYYKTILHWISAGVPYGNPATDRVDKLEVLPKEVFMHGPGKTQQVLALAHYSDGSVRDVTREVNISSNTPEIADVDSAARVKGERKGEAALLIRYEGKFVAVPVTVLNPNPGFAWNPLPQNNYIDELLDAKLKRLKIQPSEPVDDAEFLRRVSLDLTGLPPTPEEIKAFVGDKTGDRTKRSRAVDRLIAQPEYVDHWTLKWGDLLQVSRRYLGDKGMWEFREWIRDSIASNKPYDKFVYELLTARGSSYENPAANFFRVTRSPKVSMEKTTQLFMGVRLVCTQCHDHPFEKWTQNQYYEMTAFFGSVGLKPGFQSGDEIVYDKREDFEIKHPKTGRVVNPKYLVASLGAPPIPSNPERREALVEWLTSKDNPFFARAIANRIWSYFLGRGIIEPVDDIRASNPPVNEPLLEALTKDLTDHDFDLRYLMKTIVNSRAYQASIHTNVWNDDDKVNFSHAMPRRLSAEELMDALSLAAGAHFNFREVPPDTKAEEFPDPHVGRDGFLDVFGRPARESSCECERRSDISLPQALNLVNGRTIADAIADPKGRVAKLILAGTHDRAIVEELYLAALSRYPTPKEYDMALTFLRPGGSRAAWAQDLLWSLVNSKAFLYNR
ncbi:MAG TPA: DUF1549 and DUF1553 domain-containing protein [Bryobacteraceae bacterium]|nr:DUF1549 and DUF1553 domain-containing protein [Bryobacteraceae bacterium]